MHIPNLAKSFPGVKLGKWPVQVKDAESDQHELLFDSESAIQGWNFAGTLELHEGEVSVILSDKSDIGPVIADAVRLSPSDDE